MEAGGGHAKPGLDQHGLPVGYPFQSEWEVTPRQTAEAMKPAAGVSPPLLLDCRRPEEWQHCRIEGATLFPMQTVAQQADEVEEAAGGKDRPIIVYCHHGQRSLRVTAALRGMGFTDVRSMAGGIDLWSVDIDATVPRY